MTDAVYSNGDTVTFANGDVATFGHASEAHTETNDRVVITPSPRLPAGVKPVGPVEINWDHPATNKLSMCLLPTHNGDMVDMANGIVRPRNTNQSVRVGRGGVASYTTSDTHYTSSSDLPIPNSVGDDPFWIMVVWKGGGDSTSGPALYHQRNNASQYESIFVQTGRYYAQDAVSSSPLADCFYFGTFDDGFGDARGVTISNAVTGEVQCAVCLRQNRAFYVYLDGVEHVYDWGSAHTLAGMDEWSVGGRVNATTAGHTDDIYFVAAAPTEMSFGLAKQLSLDPYQFLKPAVPETQIITTPATADDRVWII